MDDVIKKEHTDTLRDEKKKSVGKLQAWSHEERLVLPESTALVCLDLAVGAQVSRADIGRRNRALLIEEDLCSEHACINRDRRELDTIRWDGSSCDDCCKIWGCEIWVHQAPGSSKEGNGG